MPRSRATWPYGDQPGERIHRRADHVVRVRGPEALGQDVGDPGASQHHPDRAARDDAGTGGGGLEQHPARAVLADDLVGNRRAGAGHVDHAPLGGLDGLADRFRDFVRLAGRDAHLALAVADGHERVEREPPATLDHLGHAIDRDDVLDVVAAPVPVTVPTGAAVAIVAAAAATPLRLRRRFGRRLGGGARDCCLFVSHARTPVRRRVRRRRPPVRGHGIGNLPGRRPPW